MLYLQAIHFLLARWKTRDNYFKLQLLKLLRKYDWEMWTTRLALFFFLSVKICTCRLQNIQLCQIYEKVGLMFLTLEKIFFFADDLKIFLLSKCMFKIDCSVFFGLPSFWPALGFFWWPHKKVCSWINGCLKSTTALCSNQFCFYV